MNKTLKSMMVLAAFAAMSLVAVRAQDDGALIDALVKKGILTDQESEDIRAQLVKDYANSPAGKLQIGSYVKQISFYGDGRLRFEDYHMGFQQGKAQNANAENTDRFRYRLRLEADYAYSDNLTAGFELETNTQNDSANQSFGSEFNKNPINIGKIFLKYKASDWATITAGKFNNPLYTTDLVWDPDIYTEGAAEVLNFQPIDQLSIGLTSAQFLYVGQTKNQTGASNTNNLTSIPTLATANSTKSNVWILAEQVPVQYNFTKETTVKFVPGVELYTGGSDTATGGALAGGALNNQDTFTDYYAGSNFLLLTAPGEINFKVLGQNVKPYWDFSYNAQGERKARDYFSDATLNSGATLTYNNQNIGLNDNVAWLAGVQVGQLKKKGDWIAKADYRQVGLTAVDPNITDSDFNNGFVNGQGIKASVGYQITDALYANVTYFNNWAYKNNLFDGATAAGGQPSAVSAIASAHNYQDVQVDIGWKF